MYFNLNGEELRAQLRRAMAAQEAEKNNDTASLAAQRAATEALRARLAQVEAAHRDAMAQQAQQHAAHLESRVAIAKDAIVDSVIARALRPDAASAQRATDSAAGTFISLTVTFCTNPAND